MFFAGHMALAYLASRPLAEKVSFSLPLVFAAAILPDLDFIFYPLFSHHTITHSLTFWSAVYAPVLAIFRWKAVPYAVATFSHFLIGDVLTGDPPLLFGLSDARFGAVAPQVFAQYGAPYGVLYQAAIDAAMAGAFVVFVLRTRSVKSLWSGAHNPVHIILLVAIVALVFFGAARNEIAAGLKQSNEIFYVAYALVALSHVALVAPFLAGGAGWPKPAEYGVQAERG